MTRKIPRGAVAVLAARDRTNVQDRDPIATGVLFLPGDTHVLAWYWDHALRIWKLDTATQVRRVLLAKWLEVGISQVALDPSRKYLYAVSDEPRLLQLDVQGMPLRAFDTIPDGIPVVGDEANPPMQGLTEGVGASDDTVIIGGVWGALVLRAPGLAPVRLLTPGAEKESGPDLAECMAVSADGRKLGWLPEARSLLIFDTVTGQRLARFPRPPGPWHGDRPQCAFSADFTVAAVAGGGLLVYDTRSGKQILAREGDIGAVAVSKDGTVLAYASMNSDIELITLPDGRTLRKWPACPKRFVSYIAMSDDAKLVATICDSDITVWPGVPEKKTPAP